MKSEIMDRIRNIWGRLYFLKLLFNMNLEVLKKGEIIQTQMWPRRQIA